MTQYFVMQSFGGGRFERVQEKVEANSAEQAARKVKDRVDVKTDLIVVPHSNMHVYDPFSI